MNKVFTYLFILTVFENAFAQTDSLKNVDLEQVVVTATRSEKMLSLVPMPVTLISQKQIQQMGSLRLNEVLQEQTGLAIVTEHGQGIQMQGFDPDYTLILIDGEPLIGRTTGTLELSRLAVGNIKQIEIVKGPSSSLYGSEALAGIVNIITETPQNSKISLSARYGTNHTMDFGLNATFKQNKFGGNIFVNRYSTSGYDFSPETFGQTVEPFDNYTLQSKLNYDFSKNLKITLSGRYFIESQTSNFDISNAQNLILIGGNGQTKDFNLNPIFHFKISDRWKTQFRLYHSFYETNSSLNYLQDDALYDATFFRQSFLRPEMQSEYFLSDKHIFTFGAGRIWESVAATRYEGTKKFETNYAFLQYEFSPNKKWNMILGGRFDAQSVYGSQFSPKLSAQYDISKKISLRASVGAGFKAPDFRQLYLNFTNAVAGYSVFGTEEAAFALAKLQAENQIAEVFFNPSEIAELKAESSWAFNAGAKIKATENLTINLNIFRNDVGNLIDTQVIAAKTNGQNVFSYRNINQVFTQGIELDFNYQINKNLSFSGGYQFLQAKDKEVLREIKQGEIFRRNLETQVTERVSKQDYGGLFGRSRDMFNLKLFYDNPEKGISANIRGIYRGKYGFGDRDGNLILDDASEYVKGYFTWNISLTKTLWKEKIRLQAGIDNLLNQQDKQNIPNLAGRLMWLSVNFQIFKPQ